MTGRKPWPLWAVLLLGLAILGVSLLAVWIAFKIATYVGDV